MRSAPTWCPRNSSGEVCASRENGNRNRAQQVSLIVIGHPLNEGGQIFLIRCPLIRPKQERSGVCSMKVYANSPCNSVGATASRSLEAGGLRQRPTCATACVFRRSGRRRVANRRRTRTWVPAHVSRCCTGGGTKTILPLANPLGRDPFVTPPDRHAGMQHPVIRAPATVQILKHERIAKLAAIH